MTGRTKNGGSFTAESVSQQIQRGNGNAVVQVRSSAKAVASILATTSETLLATSSLWLADNRVPSISLVACVVNSAISSMLSKLASNAQCPCKCRKLSICLLLIDP